MHSLFDHFCRGHRPVLDTHANEALPRQGQPTAPDQNAVSSSSANSVILYTNVKSLIACQVLQRTRIYMSCSAFGITRLQVSRCPLAHTCMTICSLCSSCTNQQAHSTTSHAILVSRSQVASEGVQLVVCVCWWARRISPFSPHCGT